MSNRKYYWLLVGGGLLLAGLLFGELMIGPGNLHWTEVLAILSEHIQQTPAANIADTLVWNLRLPRALLAGLIGAALACAGVITQGIFRNPLAAPDVLGISSGAALAAVLGFLLQLDGYGIWPIPSIAALGALAILALLLALMGQEPQRLRLLLLGVIVGAWCSAWIALILATTTEHWDVSIKIVYWLMGNLEGRTWDHLQWFVPPFVLGTILALWLRNDLDVLQLGHETSISLGVNLQRLQILSMLTIGLFVGAATAVSGIIGFIGLIVPHIVRLLIGPGHRQVLPFAAITGAILMLIVDMITRSITTIALPPGVITSLLGAPFFVWILLRNKAAI